MNRLFIVAATLFCVFLAACSPKPTNTTTLSPEDFSLNQGQSITVDIDSGSLNITQSENGYVDVSGTISDSQVAGYKTTHALDGFHLVAKKVGSPFFQADAFPTQINLKLPAGILTKVNTFDADVNIQDYSGEVNITSVAGNLLANNVKGKLTLISNRGTVTAQKSSGELHLLGNYGLLSLLDSHGTLSATTIIGTVRFNGKIEPGDNLKFETDHGPVEIQLDPASDAAVQIDTTTGVVVCSVTGINYKGERCTGTLGGGQGQLQVRTVSGNVTLQPLQPLQ
jgi:hypothetical protein